MILLVGDAIKEAYSRTRAKRPRESQGLVLRREHVFGNKVYNTKVRFGGKEREISIDCQVTDDAKLCFSVDNKRDMSNGHAVFVFKFENEGSEIVEDDHHRQEKDGVSDHVKKGVVLWQQSSTSVGMNGIEWRKRRRSLLRTARSSSSSSISMSSASTGGSSSVMEWTSVEESVLSAPIGFSLVVYVWRK
ncbi:Integrase-type DNA-binding superfamily protein [Hibiscus syriacus]|uniref:Integrase-type DNA-binding superfamily protein n=1 Tax=Hibiscus syriacus TaxID=106335 RepID=A0A6A2WGU5_HIBSY|nr:Integrase-type DNA-binding superfamily protein [Hibiscus syriacus]